MSKPTHISEYVDKHINRIKRNTKLKQLQDKYGHDVNYKQLTEQELKDWIFFCDKCLINLPIPLHCMRLEQLAAWKYLVLVYLEVLNL